jgi:hypothetical protein
VFLTSAIFETIGTEKLRAVFEKEFNEDTANGVVYRLVLAFLILELSCCDHSETAPKINREIETFIKAHSQGLLAEFIGAKLYALYYRPNLGSANRHALENLYAEVQRKVVRARTKRGIEKKDVLEEMRKLRASILGAEADDDNEVSSVNS